MKRITFPSAAVISFRTAFNRSSNSPRYFAPAMRAPRSRASTRFSFSPSGTSPVTTRWASPSTIAVFPTPGSPMRTGLFFVRRERTWITRRISSSRPMTGSSFWRRAASVRSRQYLSRAWYFASGFSSVIRWVPRMAVSAERSDSRVNPCFRRRSATFPASDANARRKCSAERNSSLNASASERARRNSGSRRGDSPRVTAPDTFGSDASIPSASDKQPLRGDPGAGEELPRDAALLAQERAEEVLPLHLGVTALRGKTDGVLQRFLGLHGELVEGDHRRLHGRKGVDGKDRGAPRHRADAPRFAFSTCFSPSGGCGRRPAPPGRGSSCRPGTSSRASRTRPRWSRGSAGPGGGSPG